MAITIIKPRHWKPEDYKASHRGEVDLYCTSNGSRTAMIHGDPDANGRPQILVGHELYSVDHPNQQIINSQGENVSLETVYADMQR